MDRRKIISLLKLPLTELIDKANRIRRDEAGAGMDLCNIFNAKSGMCSEDCRFCAQSSRHKTAVATYPLKTKAELVEAARAAKRMGAVRFGIVTSGNALTKSEIRRIVEAISEIKAGVDIKICASLGELDESSLAALKKAGLSRYHHNIETSRRYFPKIVTTHTFRDRVNTINAAKRCGLEVCSGGIIGMGETWDDRIDMALELKELDVDSVPLNVLVAIKGTPFEGLKAISAVDAVRTIAIFRIILKNKTVKIAAGRESVLKDFQSMAFMAGANGMLIGGYLTISGRAVEDDLRMAGEIEKAW